MEPLDVLIRYGVSDAADKGAWGQLVTCSQEYTTADAFEEALKDAEKEYREQIGESPSGAYRSAKSVVLQAMRLSIALVGDNGVPVGKSFIQKMLKGEKEPTTPMDNADKGITLIEKGYTAADTTEQAVIRSKVESLLSLLT